MKPLLVVGTGRCGTSAVAKIVHESGVSMGALLVGGNNSNPAGHFEDWDFRNINQWRLDGDISRRDWVHGVGALRDMRRQRHVSDGSLDIMRQRRYDSCGFREDALCGVASGKVLFWGFKDPRTAHFIDEYIELLSPRFIWCRRDLGEVMASCIRWAGWNIKEDAAVIQSRWDMLEQHLHGQDVLEVNLPNIDKIAIEEFAHG